ncbi:hypothetical protein [Polluticoccus soli]|uniref:hypothetical protein n=1 Tax=Polluticoccus soli TaxID=3034150 RepID=UPI0023E3388F|nr:hypothetical protein [Flavipsychrobacter sp. JY13-12]
MSLLHYVIPIRPLNVEELNSKIAADIAVAFEFRGADTCYYWAPGKSTRGMDITIEANRIEIRNTILSNGFDYTLTNSIAQRILEMTGGVLLNEEGDAVGLPLFDRQTIDNLEQRDCELIKTVLIKSEDIVIYGPVRKVYFGKRVKQMMEQHEGLDLRDAIFDMILKAQWGLPDFGYGNIMEVGNDGKPSIVKLIVPGIDCLVDKYDYIMLHRDPLRPLLVTNEVLNKILPASWTLVDEFTVVAPALDEHEWGMLVKNAEEYDMMDTFLTKQRGEE